MSSSHQNYQSVRHNKQLVIDINHSNQLVYLLLCIYSIAAISLTLLSLPLLVTVTAIALVGFSINYYIRESQEVVRIIAQPDNEWFVEYSNGIGQGVGAIRNVYSSSWMTLLAFKSAEKTLPIYVCLLNDSVTGSVMSQLKIRLKIYG